MTYREHARLLNIGGVDFDIGLLAQFFARMSQDRIAYVPQRKSFYVFDGDRWIADPECIKVFPMVSDFCRDLRDFLDDEGRESKRLLRGFVNSHSQKKNLLQEARSFCAVDWEEFDKDPYVVNFRDGTFSFRTGKLKPHTPSDHLTRMSGAYYGRGDPAEVEKAKRLFDSFIDGITEGNEALAGHLQRCAGYSLFGSNDLDLFFFAHGPSTRNGKTTFANLLRAVHGDYAVTIDSALFDRRLTKGLDAREMAERASLAGARLAIVSEPDRNAVLNAKLLKEISGGDPIKGGELYTTQKDILTGAKVFLFSNHRLNIDDPSVIDSRRLVYLPFVHHFEREAQDPGLEAKLLRKEVLTEAAHWLIQGAEDAICNNGDITGGPDGVAWLHCDPPEVVRQIYAVEMHGAFVDGVETFLNECTRPCDGARIKVQDLLSAYREYCSAHRGEFSPVSDFEFRQKLSDLLDVRTGSGRILMAYGVALAG